MLSYVNDASSVSEVVASLILKSSIHGSEQGLDSTDFMVDSDIATNLMMGIESSTDNLSSDTATADTFYYVSELMRAGGRRNKNETPRSSGSYPQGAIPGESNQSDRSSKSSRSSVRNASRQTSNRNDNNSNDSKEAPKDWLEKPRIYKGTNLK